MWSRPNTARVLLALAALVSVFVGPWWATLILALALCLRYRAWEVIGLGLLMDLLYMPFPFVLSVETLPWGTIVALILVFGLEPFRRRLLTGPSTF
ncbi:MAG: hypothetical protein AAB605_04190 [Patescibacteria group bacterium]